MKHHHHLSQAEHDMLTFAFGEREARQRQQQQRQPVQVIVQDRDDNDTIIIDSKKEWVMLLVAAILFTLFIFYQPLIMGWIGRFIDNPFIAIGIQVAAFVLILWVIAFFI
jgi:hypothetical protein